ncbi:importin subunit alpha-7-like [Lineus longissimus]|uniref:importin subunit alpha-7-like n=1 Tax=Lineus longissimus TaxID=88925 RepID=UPI002B4CCA62
MDHRGPYKGNVATPDSLRQRRREELTDLRKQKRERLLSTKRVRLQSRDCISETDEEISELMVKELTKSFLSSDSDRKAIMQILRRSFAQNSVFVDAFLSVDNALPSLIGLLTGHDADLQLEAAWCITNISAGVHEHAQVVLRLAAPYLITYLSSGNSLMQDQCAWALGNVAGDSAECRETLKKQGIVEPLISLLKSDNTGVQRSASFALSNIARGHDMHTKDLMVAGVAPLLLNHLNYDESKLSVISEVAWVLTYLTATGEHAEELVQLGLIEKIVNLLIVMAKVNHNDAQIVTPLLRCLGNICSGPDRYSVQACANDELLAGLAQFLLSEHHHIKKECLWALSNMTGEMNVARDILVKNLLPLILGESIGAFDIKKEVSFCICNLAAHGDEFCLELLRQGALQVMVPLLKLTDTDLLHMTLSFFEMMLGAGGEKAKVVFEECDGVCGLESLEYHDNDQIRAQASEILDKYFCIDIVQAVEENSSNHSIVNYDPQVKVG